MTAASTRTLWRYISGHHMDGIHRTDAGWVRRGTRPLAQGGAVTRWTLLSRAERAAVRVATTAAVLGTGWGELEHPKGTDETLTGAAAGAAIAAGAFAVRGALHWRHHREWIRPLHLALEGPLGLPQGTVPKSYLRIPRDYPNRTDVGRIELPPSFVSENQGNVSSIVKTKLGLTDVTVSYKLAGRKPHLLITQTPRPRAKTLFADADVRQLVERAPESAPLIGLGPQDRVVSVDLDAESPHILVSASTGGGKSVITRTMTAQMLHLGAQMVVLDFKMHSHKWARGLPNVAYWKDIADIHDALVAAGAEGHRRNRIVDEWDGDEKEAPVGPRLAILLEEANATIAKLKRYWAAVRNPKFDPKESPAIDALREVLFMGRAVKMHILLVAQSATAAALGGPEVRECFATRILARYTRNAWMMLVPEVQPVPRSSRHVGRAQVVLGGVAAETQVAFFTPEEARTWATSGVVSAFTDDGAQDAAVDLTSRTDADHMTSHDGGSASRDVSRPALTLVKGGPAAELPQMIDGMVIPPMPKQAPRAVRYSMAAASRDGLVPISADALRQAKKNDPTFPAPGEDGKWSAEDLQRWYRNRPSTRNTEAV